MKLFSPGLRRIPRSFSTLIVFVSVFGASGCDKLNLPSRMRSTATPRTVSSAPNPHSAGIHPAKLAIILDDVGGDQSSMNAIFALPYPLTLSVLPNHPQSRSDAEEAHGRGYEVMLHLPMESQADESAEMRELHPGMNAEEISATLDEMLSTVPYALGVNNHQGSLVTSDARTMQALMPLLRQRNLFFIDSRTSAATVAYEIAQRDGVRSGYRNVPFLDDVEDVSAIRRQIEKAIHGAKEKGEAIVIGHPHPETLRALRELLPEAQTQGVEFVHVSELVH